MSQWITLFLLFLLLLTLLSLPSNSYPFLVPPPLVPPPLVPPPLVPPPPPPPPPPLVPPPLVPPPLVPPGFCLRDDLAEVRSLMEGEGGAEEQCASLHKHYQHVAREYKKLERRLVECQKKQLEVCETVRL